MPEKCLLKQINLSASGSASKNELEADWKRASKGEPVFPIAPLE